MRGTTVLPASRAFRVYLIVFRRLNFTSLMNISFVGPVAPRLFPVDEGRHNAGGEYALEGERLCCGLEAMPPKRSTMA